jgi:cation diffusion facilitator family transporter
VPPGDGVSGSNDGTHSRLTTVHTCLQVGVWGNVALTAFKILAGVTGGSRAMIADGIHSGTDIVATAVVWFAYKSSKKPADVGHPYGHEGFESLAALFVALLLMVTGGFMVYAAILTIVHGSYHEPSRLALVAALISIAVKEAMYHYTVWIGKRENSPALLSNAWDHRSDVLSSVAALVGIVGARSGIGLLDPMAVVVIAVLIIHLASRILRENAGMLIDEPPAAELLDELAAVVKGVERVAGIREFKVRRRGSMYYVDVTILVDGGLSVAEGHAVAEKVERQLLNSGNRVFSSMVHVEPCAAPEP